MEPIVNRVAESDIDVFDLESLWDGREIVPLDLEPFLYQGLVLREADFREKVKQHDWSYYADRHVAVFCSADAIVPTWAYMLIASKLDEVASTVAFGTVDELVRDHYVRALEHEDWERYRDRIVVLKGCGNRTVPADAYMIATRKLQSVARKLMYGEPCSSVPIWRRPAAPKSGTAARPAARVAAPVAGPPAPTPNED